jgi:hypothetical protein
MRLKIPIIPVLIVLGTASWLRAESAPSAVAVPKTVSTDTLDRKKVHSEYGDGNFETVVQVLETYRANHDRFRKGDSVFIAKYLGVIYASNPDSREKGKYWLYKMLQLDPSADLVDLYVGAEVEGTFEKVRSEFIVRRNYRGINDTRLAKAVEAGEPPKSKDTVVLKDTVVMKGDNWISPVTDGIKGGYNEVKGGIKAGIQSGYVPIQEEVVKDDSRWTGNINVGGGLKFLNADEWEAAGFTDETILRLAMDIRQRKWPINIALDFTYAMSPEVFWDLTAKELGDQDLGTPATSLVTYDINVGVRKIFDFRLYSVRPFFGGGFGRVTTRWEFRGEKYNETFQAGKLGVWFNGGAYWELDRHFNIGVEYLYSWAKIEMLGHRNHGGSHLDMIVGFHF